jgi:uncharacterized coiled-coil DUF342 family protein
MIISIANLTALVGLIVYLWRKENARSKEISELSERCGNLGKRVNDLKDMDGKVDELVQAITFFQNAFNNHTSQIDKLVKMSKENSKNIEELFSTIESIVECLTDQGYSISKPRNKKKAKSRSKFSEDDSDSEDDPPKKTSTKSVSFLKSSPSSKKKNDDEDDTNNISASVAAFRNKSRQKKS